MSFHLRGADNRLDQLKFSSHKTAQSTHFSHIPSFDLVANLEVKVTWFGVEPEVDSIPVVTDDIFGSWILAVASSHKLL